MASSNYFNSLTSEQIDSNFTLTCVSDVKDELEASIANLEEMVNNIDNTLYVGNTGQYVWVSDSSTCNFDVSKNPSIVVCSIGEPPGGTLKCGYYGNGGNGVIMGNLSYQEDSSLGIIVGENSLIQGVSGTIDYRANDNILIGNFSEISNNSGITGPSRNNVLISNNSAIQDGSNNILIGTNGRCGGYTGSNRQLYGEVFGLATNGSICFGGSTGSNPSFLPRVQFLSDHLINLQANTPANGYNSLVTFPTPTNINGFLRIRYKGRNLLIPVLEDNDDSTISPDSV